MNEPKGLAEPRDSPYFGLDYYEEKFGTWFFGRETEGGKVITNLRAARLTLLYAGSGVGKSSLLRAGVAWRMRRLADDRLARHGTARSVPVVFSSWKDDPVPQLVAAIGAGIRPYLAGHPEPDLPPDRLDGAIEAASSAANASLYVMLDQFEEYFLYCGREPTPERFAEQLAACVNRAGLRANFLIAIREDAYAGLGDLFKGRIANVYGNYLHIDYLSHACGETAIRGPIDVYNGQPGVAEPVGIEDDLVEAVLSQVRAYDGSADPDPGRSPAENGSVARVSTPLLQLVMETVWQQERADGSNLLRRSTLENLRGVRMIVDTHLEKALGELGSGARQTAIDLFDHLVTPSGGKIAESIPDLARRTEHPEDQVGNVLTRLDDARIVRSVPAPPGQDPVRFRRYEIFHDVLAPAINHAIAARAERRRVVRRIRRLTALAAAVLLVTLAVVGVFVALWRISDHGKVVAQSGELAAEADLNAAGDPGLATLQALQALHLHYSSQAEDALRAALPGFQAVRTLREPTTFYSAAFDPADATRVASADRDGIAWIWDVTTARRLVRMSLGGFAATGGADAVAFNAAGTEVAVGYGNGQVAVFDARNGAKLHSVKLGSVPVNDVEFLGNSGVLAIAAQYGLDLWVPTKGPKYFFVLSRKEAVTVGDNPHDPAEFAVTTANGAVMWNITGGKLRKQPLPHGPWSTNDAAFSHDGREIVTADSDGSVRVYRLPTLATVMTLNAGELDATSAAFSPRGSQIVAGYSSGRARVWDTGTRLQLTQLAVSAGSIETARFSASGSEVVTASNDGTIRVWHWWPRELRAEFSSTDPGGQPNAVAGSEFLADGRIITLDQSGYVRVFTARGAQQADIKAPGTTAPGVAWNRAGTVLATGDADGTVDVWRAAGPGYTQVQLRSPIRVPGGIAQFAMSPSGSLITVVSSDNYYAIRVRSGATGQPLRTLSADNSISALAFSPSGNQLVAGDYNGQVEVWPAAAGRPRLVGKPGPSIRDLEFDQSGSEFVTASAGGTVTVWAARDDLPRRTITACPSPATAALNPNGSEIVVACIDGTARVFDAATGRQLTALPAATAGTVTWAGFSPDGKSIVTSVSDGGAGGVEVWNTELANPSLPAIERLAEQRVTQQLTPAERSARLASISG